MILKDPDLLAEFRAATACEYCERPTPHGCDPAHILSRGAGRVDIRGNLVSLCRWCHDSSHYGNAPYTSELLAIAAKREGTTVEWIRLEVYRIRREPKK